MFETKEVRLTATQIYWIFKAPERPWTTEPGIQYQESKKLRIQIKKTDTEQTYIVTTWKD